MPSPFRFGEALPNSHVFRLARLLFVNIYQPYSALAGFDGVMLDRDRLVLRLTAPKS